MQNKKSMAMQWYFLLFAFVIGIGILLFFNLIFPSVPNVGEFPLMLQQKLEKTNSIPGVTESIMTQIGINSLTQLNEQGIVKSNCGTYLGYELLDNPDCISGDLKERFKTIFSQGYVKFKSEKFNRFSMDFSNIQYDISINDENGKFFFVGTTSNNLEMYITTEKDKQVGKIFVRPNFKIPSSFDFLEYENLIAVIKNSLDDCDDEGCVENHIANKGFELQECESGEEAVFYDFLEYLDMCSNSDNEECICENKPQGTFKLRQKDDGIVQVSYDGFKQDIENVNMQGNINVYDDTILIKSAGGIRQLDTENENPEDYSKCGLEQTKFRFCVKSSKNKFYVYNEELKKLEENDLIYRFALDLGQ
jgi:hypothetical protein